MMSLGHEGPTGGTSVGQKLEKTEKGQADLTVRVPFSVELYAAPAVRMPSVQQLSRAAAKLNLQLDEEELQQFRDAMKGTVTSYQRVDQLVEPLPPVKWPRTPGWRPEPEDNPHNAWYWRTEITGASSGKLHGKTVAIKDNVAVAGVPMMCGSRVLEGYVPEYDATIITRILDAGGVIKGKAVCEDMCKSPSSYTAATGPVENAHVTGRSSGGSSSGSAALMSKRNRHDRGSSSSADERSSSSPKCPPPPAKTSRMATGGSEATVTMNALPSELQSLAKLILEQTKQQQEAVGDRLSDQIKILDGKVDSLSTELTAVRERVGSLEAAADWNNTEIERLQRELQQEKRERIKSDLLAERYSRKPDIIVRGLPYRREENCVLLFNDFVSGELGLDPVGLVAVHRLSQPTKTRPNPPLLARLINLHDRDRVLREGRRLRGTGLAVHEHLPPPLQAARAKLVPDRDAATTKARENSTLALGEVDLAIGGDQGGSIRIPAAWSGVVGLKPTYGLVPYTGCVSAETTLDHVGPMARTVEDVAMMLEVLSGYDDGLDPRQAPNISGQNYVSQLTGDISGIRVGLLKEGFGLVTSEADVDDLVHEAAHELTSAGATVEEVSVPMHPDGCHLWNTVAIEGTLQTMIKGHGLGVGWKGFYPTSMLEALARGFKSRASDTSHTLKLLMLFGEYMRETYGGRYYAKGQNLSRVLTHAYNNALQKYDVLVLPTVPFKATEIPNQDVSIKEFCQPGSKVVANTCPFNLTGHPAISINAGFSQGLPVGMMIVGRHFDDATVLKVAHAYEKIRDSRT
ncbi:QRSL1 [Branchiostoma lanceolatum]|uniref:QRSL1 protein n=1 Tax=Branchiostoma lanceolatum TaxID=7740 RepID=A0A8J9ZZE0_BRALA|nr:QRSL1 [Branchiostoma lanceolatum]